jgi:sulfur carrier protein ThiS
MKVTFKLYASFSCHLPDNRNGNQVDVEVADGTSPIQILRQHGVPIDQVHLVLVNGVFVPPGKRDQALTAGDELAVWPAVAGG